MAQTQNILLGTSGFDYPEWKGIFYPKELKRDDFLKYYSENFNAVELNFTFYNIPKKETIEKFLSKTENRVKYSVKANRQLTHEKRQNWKEISAQFKEMLEPLEKSQNLASILFQFPPDYRYTKENRIYLASLLEEFENYPKVVEFRNREWLKESVYKGLEERNTSLACAKLPTNISSRFIGPIAYIRIHEHVAYGEEELGKFLKLAEKAESEGKQVIVYFGKYGDECGVGGAVRMKGILDNK